MCGECEKAVNLPRMQYILYQPTATASSAAVGSGQWVVDSVGFLVCGCVVRITYGKVSTVSTFMYFQLIKENLKYHSLSSQMDGFHMSSEMQCNKYIRKVNEL